VDLNVFDVDSNVFDVDSNVFDVDLNVFDVDSNVFDVDKRRTGKDSMIYENNIYLTSWNFCLTKSSQKSSVSDAIRLQQPKQRKTKRGWV
jgi:hypothetical protein